MTSFYTSLSGLRAAQTDLNVISHNIANVETLGFKKSDARFADVIATSAFSDPKMAQGIGTTTEIIQQNFKMGSLDQTGAALDLAINGEGFFSTVSAQSGKTFFTRAGSFQVDAGGFVHDGSFNRLQVYPVDPTTGAVTSMTPVDAQLPATNGTADFAGVTVRDDGVIIAAYDDGSVLNVGKVAIASFTAPTGLLQVGSSNWQQTGISGAAKYGEAGNGLYGSLLSGTIERSNVDIADELVGLILAQRNFQANAKAIDTATQITQTVINLRQ